MDCRVPPGGGHDEVTRGARRRSSARGRRSSRSSSPSASPATARRPQSRLGDAIDEWLARDRSRAPIVPIVMAGFSDSHWFRKAFDACTVYGFCPQRTMGCSRRRRSSTARTSAPPSADLELAARLLRDLCQRVLGDRRHGELRRARGRRRHRGPIRADAARRDGAAKRPLDPRPDVVGGGGPRALTGRSRSRRVQSPAWPAGGWLDADAARAAAPGRGDGRRPARAHAAWRRRGCRSRTRAVICRGGAQHGGSACVRRAGPRPSRGSWLSR